MGGLRVVIYCVLCTTRECVFIYGNCASIDIRSVVIPIDSRGTHGERPGSNVDTPAIILVLIAINGARYDTDIAAGDPDTVLLVMDIRKLD